LGLALGLITGGVIWLLLSKGGGGGTGVSRTTKVVIAQQNLAQHVPIPASAVTLFDWPDDLPVPQGAVTDIKDVSGKLSRTKLGVGQVIVKDMLAEKPFEETRKGIGSEASLIVPKGKVAVAFPIDQIRGVAAALREGDFVDLLVSYPLVPPAGQQVAGVTTRQVTQITLQDVEVLRVGPWNLPTTGDTAGREAPNVTFLVNRQDALVLKFLRETSADVQFALRAAGDHDIVQTESVIIEYVDQRFNFTGSLTGKR
jgi:Flp pilus assembly protein CpaB